MKKSIYCIVDANDQLGLEMDKIQGGSTDKIGTIKCKGGKVEIKTSAAVVAL